jgi:mono/diheme cytochrome c family protein
VQVGSLGAFFQTVYGESLMIKFALISLLLVVAAFNLVVVKPGLADATAQQAIRLVRAFRRATAVELTLGVLVLLSVGILTSVAPARASYDPNPKLILRQAQVDDLIVTLGIAPGLVGPNDFDVKVTDPSGKPVVDAQVVRVLGTMRDMDMGTQEVTTTNQGGGHYTFHGDLLSMVGNWGAEVLVRRASRDDARTTFSLVALSSTTPPSTPDLVLALREPSIWLGLGMILAGFALGVGVVVLVHAGRTARLSTQGAAIGLAVLGLLIVMRTPAGATQGAALPGGNLFVPESARYVRSLVPATPDQIAAGAKTFATNCVVCHGPGGKGNGPLAATLNPRPVDLTVHGALHTEGEVYYYITNGVPGTAMPKWQDQLTDLERWQLVQFIRNIALQALTPTPGPTAIPTRAP